MKEYYKVLNMPKKHSQDIQAMSCAKIEGKTIFEHEALYVMATGLPIPKGQLVGPIDGNWNNLNIENLYPVNESIHGDYHMDKNRIFHEDQIEHNIYFIKKHFNDIYQRLDLEHYEPGMFERKRKEQFSFQKPELSEEKVFSDIKSLHKK